MQRLRNRMRLFAVLRRLRKCTGAQAMVETALVLVIGIPLCFYSFEVCMLTYTVGVIGDSARQGIRYAVVHGTDSSTCSGPSTGCGDATGANVKSTVATAAQLSFHDTTKMVVTVTYPDSTSTPGSHVLITVAYTYVPYMNYPGLAQNISATSEGVIVY